MERIAIIDLGTNTFKLLLADVAPDGKYQVLMRQKMPVKLSEGGVTDNIITTEAFQRGINVLRTFKTNLIDYYGVTKVFAFATSAIRSTSNGPWFVDYVRKHIGIDIEVITGNREAEYIFAGVRTAVAFEKKPYLVCDIGGGSTEFIIGNKDELMWKQSFRLGASRMMEKFAMSDPIKPVEQVAMATYFERKMETLLIALQQTPTRTLVGASGAFSTLARMVVYNRHGGETKLPSTVELSTQEVIDACDIILAHTHQQRQALPGMKLMRVKMMVPAAVFVRFLVKKCNFERVIFSDFAMKEGIFAQVIEQVLAEAQQNN